MVISRFPGILLFKSKLLLVKMQYEDASAVSVPIGWKEGDFSPKVAAKNKKFQVDVFWNGFFVAVGMKKDVVISQKASTSITLIWRTLWIKDVFVRG